MLRARWNAEVTRRGVYRHGAASRRCRSGSVHAPGSTGGVLVEINQEMPEAPALADEATGPVETTDTSQTTDDGRRTTVAPPAAESNRSTSAPGSAVLEP